MSSDEQRRASDLVSPPHPLHVVHLTSSRFFGGPERQMLELARELHPETRTSFLSFAENGLCGPFLDRARAAGFHAQAIEHDTPRLVAATRELIQTLRRLQADVLICHGYKADLLGLWAARRVGIPVVAVSRGWTGECRKVRVYEWLDRRVVRRMDKVVCVSQRQASRILDAGVRADKVAVIHNAIRCERFNSPRDPQYRRKLEAFFPQPPQFIIGAAGRLSPEKGFDVLVESCRQLLSDPRRWHAQHGKQSAHATTSASQGTRSDFGVVLFGEGVLREELARQIDDAGLKGRFVLAGFTDELDRYMPHFDLFVQSSHTEGLPNVLLEAAAAGVPVVATNAGGTSEVVSDGHTGVLVPPADPAALAAAIGRLLTDSTARHAMHQAGPVRVAQGFTFARQADRYSELCEGLSVCSCGRSRS